MPAGMVLIVYGAVIYGVVHLFLVLTTQEQRHRWFLNVFLVALLLGAAGLAYEVFSSAGRFIGL